MKPITVQRAFVVSIVSAFLASAQGQPDLYDTTPVSPLSAMVGFGNRAVPLFEFHVTEHGTVNCQNGPGFPFRSSTERKTTRLQEPCRAILVQNGTENGLFFKPFRAVRNGTEGGTERVSTALETASRSGQEEQRHGAARPGP